MADSTHRTIADTTASAIRAIWERNLPLIQERIDRLEAAATAARSKRLDTAMRLEANEIAHKLAGSLGMFGFPEGTEISRRLERMLLAEHFSADESRDMTELVGRLRAVVLG